jgi:hypothetical protein
MTTKMMGQEGTVFFVGVVEDILDPKNLGRVKVRCHSIHNMNKAKLPTDDLPWASVLMPATSASLTAIGRSPTGLLVGSTVVGFFMDGKEAQIPMVLGSLHGIPNEHDVSLLARATNDIDKQQVGPEPASAFAAQYPDNHTWTTKGGHKFEVDDTPNAERIHIYHKSGTYVEINNEGRVVTKVMNDNIEVVMKDKWVHVEGNGDVRIRGNLNVHIEGNATVTVDGNTDVQVGGNATVNVDGTTSVHSGGAMSIRGDSTIDVVASSTLTLKGSTIKLN